MLLNVTKHLISLQILIMQSCCLDVTWFTHKQETNSRPGLTSLLGVENMQIDGEELYSTVKYIMGLDEVLMKRDNGSKVTSGLHEWHHATGSKMFRLDSCWPVMDLIRRNTPHISQ